MMLYMPFSRAVIPITVRAFFQVGHRILRSFGYREGKLLGDAPPRPRPIANTEEVIDLDSSDGERKPQSTAARPTKVSSPEISSDSEEERRDLGVKRVHRAVGALAKTEVKDDLFGIGYKGGKPGKLVRRFSPSSGM